MRRAPNTIITLAVWGLCALPVFAEETPAEKPLETPKPLTAEESAKIEKLIQTLSDDDFSKRNAAETELCVFGIRARSALLSALKDGNADPERKARLNEVLSNAIDPAQTQATQKLLGQPVSFELVDCRLKDAVERVKTLLKLKPADELVFVVPEVAEDRAINLRVSEMSGHLALEWICKLVDMEFEVKGKFVRLRKANP